MKYHVAHILLAHKYTVDDVLRKIKEGKDFGELARIHSSCPSSERGGDLGPLLSGKADPDFEEAALELKVGEITQAPVRTKFGYHLIKRLA